jgi:thymidylate synthase (FAD)
VNYAKRPPQVILPWHLLARSDEDKTFWHQKQYAIVEHYLEAIARGWKPQDARGFLPNDIKTEIVWTMNLRSLRNFFGLRTAKAAHPDMQALARGAFKIVMSLVPLVFQDIQDNIDAAALKEQSW